MSVSTSGACAACELHDATAAVLARAGARVDRARGSSASRAICTRSWSSSPSRRCGRDGRRPAAPSARSGPGRLRPRRGAASRRCARDLRSSNPRRRRPTPYRDAPVLPEQRAGSTIAGNGTWFVTGPGRQGRPQRQPAVGPPEMRSMRRQSAGSTSGSTSRTSGEEVADDRPVPARRLLRLGAGSSSRSPRTTGGTLRFLWRTRSPLPGQVWRTYAARRVARSRTSSSATSESVTRGNCT